MAAERIVIGAFQDEDEISHFAAHHAESANALRDKDMSQWQIRDVTLLGRSRDLIHIEKKLQRQNRPGPKQEETRATL
jgi:hypothetical protein